MNVATFRCGHERTPENTRSKPDGKTCCRICDRAAARRWKQRNAEQQRAYHRAYGRAPENRGTCESGICTNLRGIKALSTRPHDRGYCAECVNVIADVRRTLAEGMWADGWMLREMCEAFGGITKAYFAVMRDRGWDLPYRYRRTRAAA